MHILMEQQLSSIFNLSSSSYLLLALYFSSANVTEFLPGYCAQALWYVHWSVQFVHGSEHLAECIRGLRTTQTMLFKRVRIVAVVHLGPHLLSPVG